MIIKIFKRSIGVSVLLSLLCINPASAEVVSADSSHYVLKHEARSKLDVNQVWQRLIVPSEWWLSSHTYSGDSNNLNLDLRAGGTWSETWETNSVVHGKVLLVLENSTLRLNAPFGPLQDMAVNVVWTIELKASDDGSGTDIIFSEKANGSAASNLDQLARAVDFVKQEAIMSLAQITSATKDSAE